MAWVECGMEATVCAAALALETFAECTCETVVN